jgi:hypothetical protein
MHTDRYRYGWRPKKTRPVALRQNTMISFSSQWIEYNVVENVVGLCHFLLIPSERET